MEYNQLKQYGVAIHEDTPDTSTPVARMIPSLIDAKYAKLFLAAKDLYEALKSAVKYLEAVTRVEEGNARLFNDALAKADKALAKAEEGK